MLYLQILGTALVLACSAQLTQPAHAAPQPVVVPVMQKDLPDVPGKEMLMLTRALPFPVFDETESVSEWSVTEGEQPAGQNSIEPDLKRCALFESWISVDGSRGRSINFYDRNRHRWHQTWIDDRGGALELDGGLVGGSMVLEGERPEAKTNASVRHRITWTPQRDGSVRQHWQMMKVGYDSD
jgi:hypothetical protein